MSNLHVLIMDDDAANLIVMQEFFSLLGINTSVFQDPAKLLDVWADQEPVDLIFLDLEMPHLNGYEMFHILHEEIGVAAPIVACSVHTNEMNEARRQGFHSFIGKPLSRERFAGQVQRILDGESVWETN